MPLFGFNLRESVMSLAFARERERERETETETERQRGKSVSIPQIGNIITGFMTCKFASDFPLFSHLLIQDRKWF